MIHIVIKRWTHRLGLIRFTQAVSPSPAKNRVRVGKNVPFISGSFSEVFSILVVLFIILKVVFFFWQVFGLSLLDLNILEDADAVSLNDLYLTSMVWRWDKEL